MQASFDLKTAYERGEELVRVSDKRQDIRAQISKLRDSKQRTYQIFTRFTIKSLNRGNLELDPDHAITFYSKDPEAYGLLPTSGLDEDFSKKIIMQSIERKVPIIISKSKKPLIIEGEAKKTATVVYVPKPRVQKTGRKLCRKLDGLISGIEDLRRKSREITIDPQELSCVLESINGDYESLLKRYNLTSHVLEKTKEGVKTLQEIYERKKGELKFVINDLLSEGIPFDFLKGCSPEEIERLSNLKPKVRKELNGKRIDGLIELCRLAQEMEEQEKGLRHSADLNYSDLRRAESLVQKLREIKSGEN